MATKVLTVLFNKFFNSEKSGGIILIFCAVFSLIITNLFYQSYAELWRLPIGNHSLEHWINDGLMTVFFLLIGLELEREIYIGELSELRNAMLPVFAAMGGMLVPAGIFIIINPESPGRDGFGVPMATDIAFALGVLSMVGKRIPASLKVFLTALAVIDDLGAIIIISIFYTGEIHVLNLSIALGMFGILLILNRLRVYNLLPYMFGGIVMWYFMLSSGVHATITGVLLAFAVPFGNGEEKSPSYILQNVLHIPVAYIILPLFALANTAIRIDDDALSTLGGPVSVGIIAGLLLGKPIGIILFGYLAKIFRLSSLPEDVSWTQLLGAGVLAGIGFTMSIFITLLAFNDQEVIDASKLAVMIASLASGVVGYFLLRRTFSKNGSGTT